MTNPKVSAQEMSAYLDGLKSGYHVRLSMREEDEVIDAIRSALTEREELKKTVEELASKAKELLESPRSRPATTRELLTEIRDFKLDGEVEK